MPTSAVELMHDKGKSPIDLFHIDAEVAKVLAPRLDARRRGYRIIDQTEALTAIAISACSFVGGRHSDQTIFKTNFEAELVIAHRRRLRHPCGIIIIGFIDLSRDESHAWVLADVRERLPHDRTKTTSGGFTQVGLAKMTRTAVVEILLDEESQHLAGMSEFVDKPISLGAEPTSPPKQYDIVLT